MISIGNHADGILYGGNGHGAYTTYIQNNGGVSVFIRQAPSRNEDSDECLRPPPKMDGNVHEDCIWNSQCAKKHHFRHGYTTQEKVCRGHLTHHGCVNYLRSDGYPYCKWNHDKS